MPYIKGEDREHLDFEGGTPATVGELNYKITTILQQYFREETKRNYQAHNDILGVLEAVKQEWYRRMTAPYEDKKIEENGDVYNI